MGMLLSPDHTATLTDPLTWKDNPFIGRDMRRDIKKRQPFLSFCWMCGVLLLAIPWTVSVLWSMQATAFGNPMFLGGDLGTRLCVVVSGVHIWFIIGAARKHTTRLFTQESNQNTLGSLLMLPISPFQILVQAMAYPWIVAMRLAVALLPVYVLCVGLDGPTWPELLTLYLVFAMAALSVPFWKQPALSENVAILADPKQGRMGFGMKQTAVGKESAARSIGASRALAFRLLLVPVVFSWTVAGLVGGMSGAKEVMLQYLPSSIVTLLDSVVISWPMIAARLLITPLDWFGFSIIPLPFVLVLFLLGKYAQLVQASEFLSVGAYRDLPLQATYRPRMRLVAGLRIAQALVITGYFWKLAVVNGALARFAPQAVGPEPGLGGFAFLLLFFATGWAMTRGALLGEWQARPLIQGERYILCRNSLLDGARYLCEPFCFAVAFYLVCCLLGRTNPFPPLVNAVAGSLGVLFLHVTLIGLAGSVLSFGVSRLFGSLGFIPKIGIPLLVGVGVFFSESIDVRNWLSSLPQVARTLAFVPLLRKLEIFSPFLGILHAASSKTGLTQRFLPGATPWSAWVVSALIVGGVFWLTGHLLGLRQNMSSRNVVTLIFNPTILGREAFSDPVQLKRSGIGKADTPFVLALIAHLQRLWDNAVVTRELRSRLRGQCDSPLLWAALGLALALSVLFFHPMVSLWPKIFGGWLAFWLMGPMRDPLSMTAAGILGSWYLVLFIAAIGNAFSATGTFFAETQKSTLGFLLSTPMTTRSIVLGKAFGVLGPSIGILAAISAWTLVLTVLFLPMVGPLALLGWFYAVLTAFTFYLMVNSITFAISAMFPKLSMSGSAWVWMLLFWFGGWPLLGVYVTAAAALAAAGLRIAALWFAFIVVGWLLILLAYVISASSIRSMRRRDLTFATSIRNN